MLLIFKHQNLIAICILFTFIKGAFCQTIQTEEKSIIYSDGKLIFHVCTNEPNIDFLDLQTDFKRWGCQLASHGHRGNSGARKASALSRELAHGKSITGHTHAPEILRDTYIVGTSTRLNLPYTDGSATSWMSANAVLYEGGLVQLVPVINGKWKRKDWQ